MKKLLTVLIFAIAIIVNAQESTLLRLNYEKGTVYEILTEITQEMGEAGGMKMSMGMSMEITDVKDDIYDSKIKFTKMTMDMDQAGITMSYDSSENEDELDDMGKMMKSRMDPILNATMFSKGNNLGEVLEMKVEPNIPGAADMANQSSGVEYPKESVKIGSTWTVIKDEKGVKMEMIYTVKSITNSLVNLEMSGIISGIGEGTIFGSVEVDKKSGAPIKSIVKSDMSVMGQKVKSDVTLVMRKM